MTKLLVPRSLKCCRYARPFVESTVKNLGLNGPIALIIRALANGIMALINTGHPGFQG